MSASQPHIAARLLRLIGGVELLSSLLINPWLIRLWDRSAHTWQNDYQHAVWVYFIVSLILGSLTLGLAVILFKRRHPTLENVALTFVVLSILILLDRFLLVCFGLPIWIADPVVHFRHRPHAVRQWPPEYTRGSAKPIRINAYGHHDDPFPVAKPKNEFRAVVLGDSISMGHGVTRDETYANQLEQMLDEYESRYQTHQIINTAVSGYAPRQEYHILKESLMFEPDLVFVGFCMNDVTEPFVYDKDLGGIGFGNQGITQFKNAALGFLYHETGWGRLIDFLQKRSKIRENLQREEVYNVTYMTNHLDDDPRIQKAWDTTLADLEKIYRLCHDNKIPVVLLIFPHTFQLSTDTFKLSPQRILTDHAHRFEVPVLDFTRIFQSLMADHIVEMRNRNFPRNMVDAVMKQYLLTYFLDWDHLTVKGHQVVAKALFDFLVNYKLIETPRHQQPLSRIPTY